MKRLFICFLTCLALTSTSVYAQTDGAIHLKDISIEDGSKVSGFSIGDSLTFCTDHDSLCRGFYEKIVDNETGIVAYEAFNSVKNDNGMWVLKFYKNLDFLQGHTYSIVFEGHQAADSQSPIIGSTKVSFVGNGSEYGYSNVYYKTIYPIDNSEITILESNFVYLEFSDEVTIDINRSTIIDEDGNAIPFKLITTVDETNNQWELTIPKEVLEKATSHIKIRIFAKDKKGFVIKGNKGLDEDSYYEATYFCHFGYPQLSISPKEGIVNLLQQLVFSNEDGLSINETDSEIILYEQDKETIVFSIKGNDLSKSSLNPFALIYSLDNEISKEADYYLHIPEGFFGLGKKNLDNKELWVKYTVMDRIKEYGVTITPSDGSVLTRLSQFVITFDKWDNAQPYGNNKEKITLTDTKGNLVTEAYASLDPNRTIYNQCIITLKTPITIPGDYRLNVPEFAFILGFSGHSHSSPMYFDYTIKEDPKEDPVFSVSAHPVSDASKSLRSINLSFDTYSYANLVNKEARGILTDTLGNIVGEGSLKEGDSKIVIIFILDDQFIIKDEGEYTLHIPSGAISLQSKVYDKEMLIPVNFNPTANVNSYTQSSTIKSNVYNMQGILLYQGKGESIPNNFKGLNIVNGRKVVLH